MQVGVFNFRSLLGHLVLRSRTAFQRAGVAAFEPIPISALTAMWPPAFGLLAATDLVKSSPAPTLRTPLRADLRPGGTRPAGCDYPAEPE